MRYYTDSIHPIDTLILAHTGIDLKTNLLSLGMVALAMVILWVLLFGC